MTEPLLVLDDIAMNFGAVQALKGISFTVGKGEVIALLGDNGAGKSTLVKIISGGLSPSAGRMTFAGRNYDIIAGLTAPLVYYFGYIKNSFGKTALLVWNILCLGLLFNIVITAVLSAPTSFQQFGFEQPNTAILYFPFVWLPCCVVPLVLLAHLVCIRKLMMKK